MSAAQVIPDLGGTGLDADVKPVWVTEGPKRVHLVHPEYLKRAHTAADLAAVVTQNGEPIVQSGETLTVGLVPPWRRYAIGPVLDGKAEVLAQHVFEAEHRRVYEDSFRFRGERLDDPDKRYVPAVREFVSWKKDVRNEGRLCPLGTHMEKQEPKRGAVAYDPAKDEFTDPRVDAVRQTMEAQLAEERRRREELEAKVNALVGRAPAKPPKPKREREMVTAPCGKEVAAPYLKAHKQFCKSGCRPEGGEAA
jgi:hypothetical protein